MAESLRVLHVAPFFSIDGAYGGPVSVAADQADALARAGHDVTLVAGWDGVAEVPSAAQVRLFRARRLFGGSFAGLSSPRLLWWLVRHGRDFDVAHVHMTRDLLTLPAARLLLAVGTPVVVQTHGQVRAERSRPQAGLDVLMARTVLGRAAAVLTLTPRETANLAAQGVPDDRLLRMDNGVPSAERRAQADQVPPVVLFSSRLAERKRPLAFVAAAELVHREAPDVVFEMWGPDGGELAAVRASIAGGGLDGCLRYLGASTKEAARERLGAATVFVLPSRAEPFPMALLEAMAAGLPSVITDETGLSETCASSGAAIVTDGSPEEMAAAVCDLLVDERRWREVADAAYRLTRDRFAVEAIASRLVEVYESVVRRS